MKWTQQTVEAIERLQREGRVVDHAPRPLPEMISERDFQAAVVKLAKRHGWRVWHCVIARKSDAGFPDLVLARGNVVIFAELKTATGQLDAPQQTWAEVLSAVGGNVSYHLWRPEHWNEIESVLTA